MTTTQAPDTTTTLAPDTTTATEGAPDTSAPPATDGMAIFEASCQRCHQADGSGGRGPSLIGIAVEQPDPQLQIDQVLEGGRGMPSFATRLSAAEIDAVVAYIRETFV